MPIGERGEEPSAKRRREVLQRTNLTKRPEGRRGSDLWPPWGGGVGGVGGPPGCAGHAGGRAATEVHIYHERAPRPGQ